MQNFLSLLDYNYDKYVLVACLFGMIGFIAYTIFKSKPNTHKFWLVWNSLVVIGAFLYIAIGAVSYLYSGAGVETSIEKDLKIKNDSLISVNDSLLVSNDSLRNIINGTKPIIEQSNNKIKEYQQQLKDNKLKYDEKIISIDRFSSDDIDYFFTEYNTRYYEIYSAKK